MSLEFRLFTSNFAAALLSGEWALTPALARARLAAPKRARWVKPLVERVFAVFPTLPPSKRLLAFLNADTAFANLLPTIDSIPQRFFSMPKRMEPSVVPLLGDRPELPTLAALGEWLKLTPAQLDWYADRRGLNTIPRADRFRLYRCRWLPKAGPNPARKFRLLEVPLSGLMRVQRTITRELLNLIPPHDAAHGFRPGRSILTNARPGC